MCMSCNGNDPDRSVLALAKLPNQKSHFLVMDRSKSRDRNAILDSKNESFIDVPDVEELEIIPDGSGFVARDTVAQKSWDESLFFTRKLDALAVSPNWLYGVLKYEELRKDDKEVGSRVHFLILDNKANILDRLSFLHVDRVSPDVSAEGMPAEGAPKKAR
jgi:hypothetical protein